jgi:hypothetical protein
MRTSCHLGVAIYLLLLHPAAVAGSPLVTGNGFGFAVVSPEQMMVSKFYAHPYRFVRPDERNPLSEGIETTNFISKLSWGAAEAEGVSAEYVDETQVIRVRSRAGQGVFFMPFGLNLPALIVSWEPSATSSVKMGLSLEWSHPVTARKTLRLPDGEVRFLRFEGVEESLLVVPLSPKKPSLSGARSELDGRWAWAFISVEKGSDVRGAAREFMRWRAGLEPTVLVQREIAEVERWRVHPPAAIGAQEGRLWRQSEVVLRMAQSREPNRPARYNHGLIVAALPEGLWCTAWVRDMAYATVALAAMGHRDEARAALLAYFDAQPTGKMREQTKVAEYQVSVVRYFGDGSEEPFFTMEGATNIEFDNWGLVLWALGEYMSRYDDLELLKTVTHRGVLYESARDYVVKPLLANLEPHGPGVIVASDTSIWEERQKDAKHFAFSSAAAIAGLHSFGKVAQRMSDEHMQTEIAEKLALLDKGFNAAFVREGHLRGTLEDGIKNDVDGAILAAINLGAIADLGLVSDMVERMEYLKVRSGGYRRVRSVLTDPAIFEYWYERQEFLFVDFSLIQALRSLGKNGEADSLFRRIVQKAAEDHNLVPEMYVAESCDLFPGEIGAPTGARPMVGYGAGAYILDALAHRKVEAR